MPKKQTAIAAPKEIRAHRTKVPTRKSRCCRQQCSFESGSPRISSSSPCYAGGVSRTGMGITHLGRKRLGMEVVRDEATLGRLEPEKRRHHTNMFRASTRGIRYRHRQLTTSCDQAHDLFTSMAPAQPGSMESELQPASHHRHGFPLAMAVRIHVGRQREMEEVYAHFESAQVPGQTGTQAATPATPMGNLHMPRGTNSALHARACNAVLDAYAEDHDVAWVPRTAAPAHLYRLLTGGRGNLPEGINPCGDIACDGSRPGWMLPAAVHREVPSSRWTEPKCRRALDKEWAKLLEGLWSDGKGKCVWDENSVREMSYARRKASAECRNATSEGWRIVGMKRIPSSPKATPTVE